MGPDGRSRGFGTVSYANEADAERAVNLFNGCVVISSVDNQLTDFILIIC